MQTHVDMYLFMFQIITNIYLGYLFIHCICNYLYMYLPQCLCIYFVFHLLIEGFSFCIYNFSYSVLESLLSYKDFTVKSGKLEII